MARKSQQELKAEQDTQRVTSPEIAVQAGVSRIDDSMPLVDMTPRLPDRSKPVEPTPEQVIVNRPKKWRVLADVKIMIGTGITTLRANKVIDDRTYNLEQLRTQGVKLELVEE